MVRLKRLLMGVQRSSAVESTRGGFDEFSLKERMHGCCYAPARVTDT